MEHEWRNSKSTEDHTVYKNAVTTHHQNIRGAKKATIHKRLSTSANNSTELFAIVKKLMNPVRDTSSISPSQNLCTNLATFFHEKNQDTYDGFRNQNSLAAPTNTTMDPAPHQILNSWTLITKEVTQRLMNSIHLGAPSDPCPHHIFNPDSATIKPELCRTINQSFEITTFPSDRELTEINSLLKQPTVDPRELKNCRPIALLPFPDKLMEKAINRKLTEFLERHQILDPSQSRFRSNHSTKTALLEATDDIHIILDHGGTSTLILLKISAAFDTVFHSTHCARLHNAGIRDKALDWIRSSLTGRTQNIRLLLFTSEPKDTCCGVPQG
ncbi:hypothetical protein NDU88_002044 [Pleurodeles waltl]|uniref:Reverse transcriptase domain-containing protein n=1 Tax=Pleurodeles waltl TaxID=8319 RepID=A0AAV7M1A3_PLEWA|nr:hypothetical protein NDU88_002044 [Pleurodeles waltl]